LERREGFGITTPDPIPHPDDIIIDMKTGSVRMKGPSQKRRSRPGTSSGPARRSVTKELGTALVRPPGRERNRKGVVGRRRGEHLYYDLGNVTYDAVR
jgi:hypothetical protein